MSGLFGRPQAAPPPQAPPRMADRDSPTMQDAKQRSIAASLNRTGRASTILSQGYGDLGGSNRSTLG